MLRSILIINSMFSIFLFLLMFQGLTGLLQSPIRGAEKHGLPGVVSGESRKEVRYQYNDSLNLHSSS